MRCVVAFLVCLAFPLQAQSVFPCDERAALDEMATAANAKLRTFANGDVEISVLDTRRPTLGNAYVQIISPPRDDLGERQCRMIGLDPEKGFAGIDMDTLDASYSPATGLHLTMVIRTYDPVAEALPRRFLKFSINQATGDVAADIMADNL